MVIVLSIGGSLIAPNGPDIKFLKKLRKYVDESKQSLVLVIGGGKLCRDYINAQKSLNVKDNFNNDLVGIQATHLNAALVRSILKKTDPTVYLAPKKPIKKYKVIVSGGWKPGATTDNVAVRWAEILNAKTVYNLTNIDYVYDKHPSNNDAKPIKHLTWNEFKKLAGKHKAGMNIPFDPVAANRAHKNKMSVWIVNGKNTKRLKECLNGKKTTGTLIN